MNRLLLIATTLIAHSLVTAELSNSPSNLETTMQTNTDNTLVIGDWSAELDLGIMKLTLVLHASQTQGALSGSLDCIEQGIAGMPVDTISFENPSLTFEIKSLNASFNGNFSNKEISGTFVQAGRSLPLTFKQGAVQSTLKRPQEPKPPYPYLEEEVSYENPDAGLVISGTLTLPNKAGPFPTVLLVAGSGPHNRNEEVLGHKIFLVLADHLTRQGIAVLRVDKRGCAKTTGNYETATSWDFGDDVLAGIKYLKTRKEVSRIGLIGHSEGGIVAPIAAAKSDDVDFIVLMAGPGVLCEDVLITQAMLIQQADGVSEEAILADRKLREETFKIIKNEPDIDIAEKLLREAVANHITALPESLRTSSGKKSYVTVVEENADAGIKFINTVWFRSFIIFDPRPQLKKINIPVLAMNGELDLQVSSKQNLPVIEEVLKQSGNSDYTVIELPKLNHLFQSCETGSISEYSKIEETLSPIALNLISDWILERTSIKR